MRKWIGIYCKIKTPKKKVEQNWNSKIKLRKRFADSLLHYSLFKLCQQVSTRKEDTKVWNWQFRLLSFGQRENI